MRTFFLSVILTFSAILLIGQKAPKVEFGRISKEDRQLMSCPVDSNAVAYTLYDQFVLEFIQNNDGAPRLIEQYHRRVKLLTAESFHRANVELIFSRDAEKINNLRGMIHLPRGRAIELKRNDFVLERYDDDRNIYRFSFPKVTEGAVIEYTYSKYKNDPTAPTPYEFGEDIPVRWADFRTKIPTYFNYVDLSKTTAEFDVNFYQRVRDTYGKEKVDHLQIHLGKANVPAYVPEVLSNNFRDYVPQIRLRLKSVEYPGRPIYNLFEDWESLMVELDGASNFGNAYQNRSNFNRAWRALSPTLKDISADEEKIQAIYQFVADRVSWNGEYAYGAGKSLDKVFDRGEGTSGELNLLLLGLLQRAGLTARPVLVPLRNRGVPRESFAVLDQFEHTIVLVEFAGGGALLDVDRGLRPPGLPRMSALNHRALLADPERPFWIDVQVPKSSQTTIADLTLQENGVVSGKIKAQFGRYFASKIRRRMENTGDANSLAGTFLNDYLPGGEVRVIKSEGEATPTGPVVLTFDVRAPIGRQKGDSLQILPVILPLLEEELTNLEERISPVDFAFPFQKKYVANLTVPEGYTVQDLPKPIRLRSEDGGILATFSTTQKSEKSIVLNYAVDFSRAVYDLRNNPSLSSLFRRIQELQQRPIMLKRTLN